MFKLYFRDIVLVPEDAFHLTRTTIKRGETFRQHTHDFTEIILIDRGETLHVVNGESIPMGANHLVMIRMGDIHGFKCTKDSDLVLAHVAFRTETLEHIRDRYYPNSQTFYGGKSRLPSMMELNGDVSRRIGEQVDLMANAPRTLFQIERFLLNLFHVLESHSYQRLPPLCPDWLKQAYALSQTPEAFRGGVKAFQHLCGKSATHVARACKAWLNTTPSQVLNRFRMDYAAKELSMTDRAILDISLDCGFDSLSYFYRLFRQSYAMSPKEYRIRSKSVVGGEGWSH